MKELHKELTAKLSKESNYLNNKSREPFFFLIYSVKPSFFRFLNKLSSRIRSSLRLAIILASFLFAVVLRL